MSTLHIVVHSTGYRHTVRRTADRFLTHSRNRAERRKNSSSNVTASIPLLVTSDKHLLDVDEDALLLAFNDADLLPVHPSHPKRLLKALR
ncbi:MAG: hypothetical protein L0Z50_02940 [Verrucomicrobiales bacterium]|nr:hypothetical protein [Verrucomicrobiales bacterium]